MATVAALHARAHGRFAYLYVIEGLEFIWTNEVSITTAAGGASAFMGADLQGRTIKGGLKVPASLTIETDLRTGLLRDTTATFSLQEDYTDYLATLFRSEFDTGDLEQMGERLDPSEDLAPATKIKADAVATVTIRDRHIGVEMIGPLGERRYRYITPSDAPPGLDHPFIVAGGGPNTYLSPIFVGAEPYAWAGRRCALYRVVYDPDSADYQTWQDQFDGGSLIWVGQLKDRGRIVGSSHIEVECWGPASWTRKLLNTARDPTPLAVSPLLETQAGERGLAIIFSATNPWAPGSGGIVTRRYDASIFDDGNDFASGDDDFAAIRDHIATVMEDTRNSTGDNSTGGNGAYEPNLASFDGHNVSISYEESTLHFLSGYVEIVMHERYWSRLGWDVYAQPLIEVSSNKYARFSPFDFSAEILGHGDPLTPRGGAGATLDTDGYFIGRFGTATPDTSHPDWGGPFADNEGFARIWNALYSGGVVSLQPGGLQDISMGLDSLYIETQRAVRPSASEGSTPPEVPDGSGDTVDSMGWWMFTGQIARGADAFSDADFRDYVQIARCSWKDDGGKVKANASDTVTRIRVEKLEDPRAFGNVNKRMGAAWVSSETVPISAQPIAVFGGYYAAGGDYPDEAHRVVTRILLSSGTVGAWTSPLFLPPTPGDNQPSAGDLGSDGFWGGDLEIADLGLNIPIVAVDYPSFRAEAVRLPSGAFAGLARCKYAYAGPVQSEEVLKSIMGGRGWALSWKKASSSITHPQWGCFTPFLSLSPEDVDIALTESDKAGRTDDNSSWVDDQELRHEAPIDEFRIAARWDVASEGTRLEQAGRSRDREARGRGGNVLYEMVDHGLSDPSLWWVTDPYWRWELDWRERFLQQAGEWYGQRNFVLTSTVSRVQGQYCYPGTVISKTDPRPMKPDGGGYGLVAHLGRIFSTQLHLRGDLAGSTTYKAVMQQEQAGDSDRGRLWGPSGRIHAIDIANELIYLTGPWSGDWLSAGADDVVGFDEPSYSTVGGVAKGFIMQSEDGGETWPSAYTVTFDFSTVDTGAKTITMTSRVGTIYRDMDKLVFFSDYDAQTAGVWVNSLFIVHTEGRTDEFGTGPTPGWRLT